MSITVCAVMFRKDQKQKNIQVTQVLYVYICESVSKQNHIIAVVCTDLVASAITLIMRSSFTLVHRGEAQL